MAPLKVVSDDKEKSDQNVENEKPYPKKDAWAEVPLKQPKALEDRLEKSLNSTEPGNQLWAIARWKAGQFSDAVTMHGIRYIFARDICMFRR